MKTLTNTALVLVLAAGAASADPVIYDNGPWTGEILMSSQLDNYLGLDSACADDFYLDDTYLITDVHWIGGYYNGSYVAADWRVTFYEDTGGAGPGGIIYQEDFLWSSLTEMYIGDDLFGYANYSWDAYLTDPFWIGPGFYWVSFQGMNDYPPQAAVSGTTAVNYSQLYFGSDFFAVPYWTPGDQVFGVQYDMVFQITGIPAPASIALLGMGGLLLRRR